MKRKKCTNIIILLIIYCLQMNWIIVFCIFIALDCLSLFDEKAIMKLSFWFHLYESHIKMDGFGFYDALCLCIFFSPKQSDPFLCAYCSLFENIASCLFIFLALTLSLSLSIFLAIQSYDILLWWYFQMTMTTMTITMIIIMTTMNEF